MHCFVESLATREKIKECISCSTILGTILARKLPQEIKDKIPWEKLREKWTVNYVIELVNQALFALEALGEHLNKPATPKPDQKKGAVPKPQFRNSKPTTTLYTTGNNTANSSYPSSVTCRFCKEEHWPSECPSVYTLSDRKQFCIDNHWCENCFSRDHQGSQCNTVVYCRTCKEQHHVIFCPARISKLSGNKVNKPHNNNRAKRPPNTNPGAETDVNTLQVVSSSEKTVALPLADLSIRGVKGYLPVRTIIDSGSQKCLIAKPVVKALGLVPHDSIFIAINGINQRGSPQKRDVVHLDIKTFDGLIKISAVVVDHLSTVVRLPGLVRTTRFLRRNHIYLANPRPFSDNVTDVGLLIGADYLHRLKLSCTAFQDIQLLNSKVGHMIYGELPFASSTAESQVTITSTFQTCMSIMNVEEPISVSSYFYDHQPDNTLIPLNNEPCLEVNSFLNTHEGHFSLEADMSNTHDDLDRLWSLTHIGIAPDESWTQCEKSTMESFVENLSFQNGKYVVSLPWKRSHPPLPDNYSLSKRRLYSVVKQLRKNPPLLDAYSEVLRDQLQRDFIEEVRPSTPLHPSAKLHYLPHHGVRKSSNTTALRLVFDCSSNNPSLNSCLNSGPSLVADLTKVFLNFRLKPYASSSDIEKAFLGIRLSEQDKDSTRFLWLRDPEDPHSPIVTYRFKSVLFGATCSPFLLAACLKHHVESSNTRYPHLLRNQVYVDNVYGTFESEEEMMQFH